jgi:predicted Zn-dependent protease
MSKGNMGDSRSNSPLHLRTLYWRARLGIGAAIVLLAFCLFATTAADGADIQTTRRLPKAGFPILSPSPSGSGLPSSTGMHLTDGLDRGPTDRATRYDPGEPSLNMAVVRWEAQQMPLLVWISPGLMLPPCPFDDIQSTRVDLVASLLQQPGNPFAELKQAPGWTPDLNDQVATGIEEWREFENEGLFRFAFTDDPHNANILIFFCGSFSGGSAPGGIAVGGITSAQVYTLEQAHGTDKRHKPVVIELSSLLNSTPEKMIGASAHEFGHALGIKAHSPYRDDIMYVDRVVNQLSPGDKSTIRWLYHQPPKYVL